MLPEHLLCFKNQGYNSEQSGSVAVATDGEGDQQALGEMVLGATVRGHLPY